MSLKPLKYIKFDNGKGILYSAGTQSLLIPVSFIVSLNSILASLVGWASAQILIYKIGQAIGEGYAETLKEIFKKEKIELDKETFLRETFNAIYSQAGWGRIEIKEFNLQKKKIAIKITNSISSRLLKGAQYNLEKGIFSGACKKITGKDIYLQTAKENLKENSVFFNIPKKVPKGFLIKEEMALLTRKELEEKVKKTTKILQEKIEELERFNKLTVGRELKMIQLKEEVERLKKEKLEENNRKID